MASARRTSETCASAIEFADSDKTNSHSSEAVEKGRTLDESDVTSYEDKEPQSKWYHASFHIGIWSTSFCLLRIYFVCMLV
jgi:hypothetical protein